MPHEREQHDRAVDFEVVGVLGVGGVDGAVVEEVKDGQEEPSLALLMRDYDRKQREHMQHRASFNVAFEAVVEGKGGDITVTSCSEAAHMLNIKNEPFVEDDARGDGNKYSAL